MNNQLELNTILSNDKFSKQKKYWQNIIQKIDERTVVSSNISSHSNNCSDFNSYNIAISDEVRKKIIDVSNNNLSIYILFLTSIKILFHKYFNLCNVILISPVYRQKVNNDTINNLVYISNEIKSGATFKELLNQIKQNVIEAYNNQDYPFEELNKEIKKNHSPDGNTLLLSDIACCFEDIHINTFEENPFSLIFIFNKSENSHKILGQVKYKSSVNIKFIEQMSMHLVNILSNALQDPSCKISDLKFLSNIEISHLLYELNKTESYYPHNKTVISIFEDVAEHTPNATAVIFEGTLITYKELNTKANQLGHLLIEKGVKADTVVAIIAERSIEMIIGIFGIMKSGGAYLPIDPFYPKERKKYMLENSRTHVVLIQEQFQDTIEHEYKKIIIDKKNIFIGEKANVNRNNPQDLAYVIYTSGTTGNPKGVMIEHGSLVNRLHWMQKMYPIGKDDTLLQKTPFTFDVSVWEIFWWSLFGSKLCMLEPGGEKDPMIITKTIKENNVTIIHFVPSMLNAFLNQTLNNLAINDLSSLHLVIVSGEALLPIYVEKFNKTIRKQNAISLANLYGPTEATIDVSYYNCPEEGNILSVPIGKPIDNITLYILNKENQLQPIGIPGELHIGGVGLARGYLNNEELTREKFIKNPFSDDPKSRLYKTGDLVKYLPDGNIEYLGRIDNQVKIRGQRIELGEIESYLNKHEKINESVVITQGESSDKYLCAYIVSKEELDSMELKQYLLEYMPEYMVPSYFIRLEHLPLTSNGKVNRKSLHEHFTLNRINDGRKEPQNNTEKILHTIWKNILPSDNINCTDNFIDLGGHSLRFLQLVAEIGDKFSVNVLLSDLKKYTTIEEQAKYISQLETQKNNYKNITCTPENFYKPFPLTEVQSAYLQGRNRNIEMGGTSTHGYTEITTSIDLQKFNKYLNKIIQRHPMLRAVINMDATQQILKEELIYNIDIEDIRGFSFDQKKERILSERKRMSHHIFTPNKWPLFEFKGFRLSDEYSYLCVGIDPLIMDAGSSFVILKELKELIQYPEKELPPLNYTFHDYMLSFEELKKTAVYENDKKYWFNKIENFPAAPNLPYKQSPENIKEPFFKRSYSKIEKNKWEILKKNSIDRNISPTSLLCAIYAKVLGYWSNQQKVAINLTVFNRYIFHPDVNRVVGDFTTVILIEVDLDPNKSMWDIAVDIQKTIYESLDHRHFDGIEFVRELAKHHGLYNKAIMPIVFTSLINHDIDDNQTENNQTEELLFEKNYFDFENPDITQTSQVFIDNKARELYGDLIIEWDFVENLFDENIINSIFSNYVESIELLINNSDVKISTLNNALISQINKYNSVESNFVTTTLHQLFKLKAKECPDKISVVNGSSQITYKELDILSDNVAFYLKEKGIGANDLVGVLGERKIETIGYVLGILKLGAAYVPIDPEYPEDRINYILSNCNCKFFINKSLELNQFTKGEYNIINDPNSIAYIIHTSGSTGKPKGVQILHNAAVNTILDINSKFEVKEKDRILAISSMSFDLSVYDIFGCLAAGGTIVQVADPKDVDSVLNSLLKEKITIWNSVPAIMTLLISSIQENIHNNVQLSNIKNQELDKKSILLNTDTKYYWSSTFSWNVKYKKLYIGNYIYQEEYYTLFPKFYFLTQDGIKINHILNAFNEFPNQILLDFIFDLISKKIIINTIQAPNEVFMTQSKYFNDSFNEEIMFNEAIYEEFKKKQINRQVVNIGASGIQLSEDPNYLKSFSKRRSYRKFEEDQLIPFNTFSNFLSVYKQTKTDDSVFYNYASAGGLYPIDLYIYVKKDRIEHLSEGLYFYSPVLNKLILLNNSNKITEDIHFQGNKPIFSSSAFTLFFMYNPNTNMPKYGHMGYYYATIDTGLMVGLLTNSAELCNIGLCSIGSLDFNKFSSLFELKSNEIFLHAVEGGMKCDSNTVYTNTKEISVQNTFKNIFEKCIGNGLRLVLLSGDWIPLSLPKNINNCFPDAKIISLGGATEASIWSIYFPVNQINPLWKSIPYGYPLANQKCYVLNYLLEPCPVDVIGEIYIGGIGLGEGYINDIIKTDNSFIVHPLYGKLYKTGDYGKWHSENYIEFLGRKDNQVKIRGYRIELGEIENQLCKHKDIKESIVITSKNEKNELDLCAYYIPSSEISISELKDFLSKTLPLYMIPSHFIKMDKFPLTGNGKIDKKKLLSQKTYNQTFEPKKILLAESQIQKELLLILQEILPNESLSIATNFFELGINSVDIIKISRKVKDIFQIELPIISLYEFPTVQLCSEFIEKEMTGKQEKELHNSQRVEQIKEGKMRLTDRRNYKNLEN